MPEVEEKMSYVTMFKQAYSMILVIFSIIIIIALMFTGNTKMASDAHPVAALIIMSLGVLWMSMVNWKISDVSTHEVVIQFSCVNYERQRIYGNSDCRSGVRSSETW